MTTEKSIVEKNLPTLYYAVNSIRTVNSIRIFRSYGTRDLRLLSKHGECLDSYAIYRVTGEDGKYGNGLRHENAQMANKHGECLNPYAIYRCYRIYRVCEGGNIFFNNLIAVKDKVVLALESKENAGSFVAGNRFASRSEIMRLEVLE